MIVYRDVDFMTEYNGVKLLVQACSEAFDEDWSDKTADVNVLSVVVTRADDGDEKDITASLPAETLSVICEGIKSRTVERYFDDMLCYGRLFVD